MAKHIKDLYHGYHVHEPKIRYAKCHPDRKQYAIGLCEGCYFAQLDNTPPLTYDYLSRMAIGLSKTPSYIAKESVKPKVKPKNKPTKRKGIYRKYKVKAAWYEEQVTKGCGICGKYNWGKLGPCIDHDHSCCPKAKSCGKCVRGVLCGPCNSMLGMAKDNPVILQNAIAYLRKSSP